MSKSINWSNFILLVDFYLKILHTFSIKRLNAIPKAHFKMQTEGAIF